MNRYTFYVSVLGLRFTASTSAGTEAAALKNVKYRLAKKLWPNFPIPIAVSKLTTSNPQFMLKQPDGWDLSRVPVLEVWSQYWGNEKDNISAPDEAVDGQGFEDGDVVGETERNHDHTHILAPKTNIRQEHIIMAKRKLLRAEAFKLVRSVKESAKPIKFVKKEDAEDGQVFGIVTPDAGDATVKFVAGDLLVGPFSSPEEAREAMGDDVALATGEGEGEVSSEEGEGEEQVLIDQGMNESGKKVQSNLMRMRRNVVESIHGKVLKDIKTESEKLDIDTDVKSGQAATDDDAGALDTPSVKPKVAAPEELGVHKNDVDSSSDAAATNSDGNMLECAKGQLVRVLTESGKQVDSGVVAEATKAGFKLEGGEEVYAWGKYQPQVLVSN